MQIFLYQQDRNGNAGQIANAAIGNWYDSSWSYRKQLTISHTKIPHTDTNNANPYLANFPLLVSSTIPADKVRSDHNDIIFVNAAGTQLLNYEIESYNSTSGVLTAWVQIPRLNDANSNADTSLYVYYGNPNATSSRQNKAAVWGSNYKMVQHMNQNPGGKAPQFIDSTQYGQNGTSAGNMTSANRIAGKIGNAISFDGQNDYISTDADIDLSKGFYQSFWFRRNNNDTVQGLTEIRTADGVRYRLFFSGSGRLEFDKYPGEIGNIHGSTSLGTWTHVAISGNATTASIYMDGVLAEQASADFNLNANGAKIYLGAITKSGVPFQFMNGSLDEVRMSDSVRSADWIKTEYNNQSNPSAFYVLSGEEARASYQNNKAIVFFNFDAVPLATTGVIDEAGHTVSVGVPYGTDLTKLVPTIKIQGASVSPATGVAQDFTQPVVYTVTAYDGSTVGYTVTVKMIADATVNVNENGIIRAVPASFVGFSANRLDICNYVKSTVFQQDTALDQKVSNMFTNLGPGVIRIGNYDSVNNNGWSPDGDYRCGGPTVFNKAMVDGVLSQMHKIDWKVMWGLNLGLNNPSASADEASYVYSKAGSDLLGVEIGNEPNRYSLNGLRSESYDFATYKAEWESYKDAIKALGGIPIVGPDMGSSGAPWIEDFAPAESKNIKFLTYHFYSASGNSSGATTSNLLSKQLMSNSIGYISSAKSVADRSGLPLVVGETNSLSEMGKYGVSDSFASSLWGVDYMFSSLEKGAVGVNFHGALSSLAYSAIYPDGTPKALYYALLFFHNAAPDGNAVSSSTTSGMNVVSHAVVGSDGNLNVVIVNKDPGKEATVEIDTQKNYAQASAIYLTAPSVDATSGFTFGGEAVASDGTWTSGKAQSVELSSNTAYLRVPAGSAALVKLYALSLDGGASSQKFPVVKEAKIKNIQGDVVNFSLNVDNAAQMMFSDNSSFTDCTWETYGTSRSYTRKGGQDKIYLKFRSATGYSSSVISFNVPTIAQGAVSSGTLLKSASSPKVYAIIDGKKKWISAPEVFEQLGYRWTDIQTVSDTELTAYADYEDNLIREKGDYKIYLVVNGVKRHISSPDIFLDYGFSWSDVEDVDRAVLEKYRDANLLRESGSGDIYYAAGGIRKWIPNIAIFNSYGDKSEDVQVVSRREMNSYQLSSLIRLADSREVYFIEGKTKKHIPSPAVFSRHGFNWGSVMTVNSTEYNWYEDKGELG